MRNFNITTKSGHFLNELKKNNYSMNDTFNNMEEFNF